MSELNFDPIARLRASLPESDQRIVAIMEKVKNRYIVPGWEDDLRTVFLSLLRTIATPRRRNGAAITERRMETRAILVLGEPGTGKSETLEDLFANHPSLPGFGIPGSGCPLITVSVPAPCTLETLGTEILHAAGYLLKRELREKEVWKLVRRQLPTAGVLVIHFDEMHNLIDTANVDQKEKIFKMLKALVASRTWPVGLVISGLPHLAPEIRREIDEVRRRGKFIKVPLVHAVSDDAPEEEKTIQNMIRSLSECANLEMPSGELDEVARRLAHAALYRMGIMIEMIQEAIEAKLVEDEESDEPQPWGIDHFATAYALRSGVADGLNPFLAADWSAIDCTLVMADEAPKEPTLPDQPARRRGRKPKVGSRNHPSAWRRS